MILNIKLEAIAILVRTQLFKVNTNITDWFNDMKSSQEMKKFEISNKHLSH